MAEHVAKTTASENPGPSRIAEAALLYAGLPAVLAFLPGWLERRWGVARIPWVVPTLLVAAGVAFAAMRRAGTMRRGELWRVSGVSRRDWAAMLARFGAGASLLAALLAALKPEALLSFPRAAPRFWLFVCAAYPALSVIPQGILYRALWEKRYAKAFPPRASLVIGAALFAWAHVVFRNVPACAFTFVGGLFFLSSYRRTGSLLFSAVEHALYGDFIFTIGWGTFFYEGTQAALATAAG